jgi:hypothetical protein
MLNSILLLVSLVALCVVYAWGRFHVWRFDTVMAHRRVVTSGYIYFIQLQSGNRLLVKIGRSVDPIKRIRALRTSAPYGIKVLGIMPTMNDVNSERIIHQRFATSRISKRNEWFQISVPLLLYINAVSDPAATAVVRKAVQ